MIGRGALAFGVVVAAFLASPESTVAEPSQSDISSLVRTLDADPEPLHSDFTPSVQRLIELGLPGAAAVVDLFDAPESTTRLHAQRVVEGVVMRRNGWLPNRGYPDRGAEQKTKELLKANGSYRYDAPPAKRVAATKRWRAWVKAVTAQDAKDQGSKAGQPAP
jgi:hypothetical protein